MHQNTLCHPHIPSDLKTPIWRNVSFLETALGPPKHEKYCINISRPGLTGMHYETRKSHQMQKHMFGVTCPDMLFIETAPGPPEHEK
jgi:hypothetical protein